MKYLFFLATILITSNSACNKKKVTEKKTEKPSPSHVSEPGIKELPVSWKKFTSRDKLFEVESPGLSSEGNGSYTDPSGQKRKVLKSYFRAGPYLYNIIYYKLNEEEKSEPPVLMLGKRAFGIHERLKATISNRRTIKNGIHPGLAFDLKKGVETKQFRIFTTGDYLFILTTSFNGDNSADSIRFLDSFKIL
ncbi:hypothetical protein KKF34_09320 [Myxococcota bacterium]|nr:hypothetical protein [Myxococcota bacterium]MBU1379937.1 hypothetical protein [Myxococcota bacterium]MBU1497063.1 hypothetical protein [Myxococcota bacterium]